MQKSGYLLCHHHGSPNTGFQLYSRIVRNVIPALSSVFLRYPSLHAFLHLKNISSIFLRFRDVEAIIFPFSENVNRYFLIFSDFILLTFLIIQETKKETSFDIFSVSYTNQYLKMPLIWNNNFYRVLSLLIFSIVFFTSL